MERASLSRSNGSRCPCFLITVSSRNCTRSKVVKRAAQFGQKRRRLIAPRSSVGRESFTWVSSAPQNGQRTVPSACFNRSDAPSEVVFLACTPTRIRDRLGSAHRDPEPVRARVLRSHHCRLVLTRPH